MDSIFEKRGKIKKALEKHANLLESLKKCDEHVVNVDSILDYAELITETLYAPEGWQPGMPLLSSIPPAPQLSQMRMGKLAEYEIKIKEMKDKANDDDETNTDTNNDKIIDDSKSDNDMDIDIKYESDVDNDMSNNQMENDESSRIKEEQISTNETDDKDNKDDKDNNANKASTSSSFRKIDINFGMSDSDDD